MKWRLTTINTSSKAARRLSDGKLCTSEQACEEVAGPAVTQDPGVGGGGGGVTAAADGPSRRLLRGPRDKAARFVV